MFASRRKHKVIGRTKILINSTTLKKEIKYQGELFGTKTEIEFSLINISKILKAQKTNAAPKLKERVVVTG